MKQPRFSIVIPTRNRSETLRAALETCLRQDFEDYEIVVCDNSDSGDAKRVTEEANSSRIRYLPSTRPLAMSANWERGLNEARGEYVTVLGDDDGFMPFALRELDVLATRTKAQAIQWNRGIYTWPTIGVAGEENLLQFTLSRTCVEVNAHAQIAKVIRYEAGSDSLPMIYCSVIHRDLIQRHRDAAGRIFLNIYPDIYSGFGFGYLAGSYLSVSVPMNIAGLSHASNGVATLMKKDRTAVSSDFDRLNAEFGYVPHPRVPRKMLLAPVHVADSFLHAKDALFPDDASLVLDRKAMTERYLGAIVETDPQDRAEVRDIIRASVADDPDLLHWFDSDAPSPPPATLYSLRPRQLGFDGTTLNLQCDSFGVRDVAGAVELAASVLRLDQGPIAYNLPSLLDMDLHVRAVQAHSASVERNAAEAREQAAAELDRMLRERDAAQAHCADVQEQLQRSVATTVRLQQQLDEALRAGSLRFVPQRMLRKIAAALKRPRGT